MLRSQMLGNPRLRYFVTQSAPLLCILLLFVAGCQNQPKTAEPAPDAATTTTPVETTNPTKPQSEDPKASQEPQEPEVTEVPQVVDTTPAKELPDLLPIQKDVERIRGLAFKKDVPGAVQSLDDFGKLVDEELEKGFPLETRDGVMKGLMRLGILDTPIDLGAGMKDALLSQAAAYYDPETDRFYYLMDDLPKAVLDVTAAHELVHALQDQHFDLDRLMKKIEDAAFGKERNDDRILALRYLVEGEATYVMTHWQMKAQMNMDLGAAPPAMEEMTFKTMAGMSVQTLIAMSSQQAQLLEEGSTMREAAEAMKDIPSYLLGPLIKAYMGGAYFTMKVRHKNGWEGISKVYADLPTSSEQTIHPEKYLDKRDLPTALAFPEFQSLEGWKYLDGAVHGEYYLTLLLDQSGHDRSEQVAAGWDGDLYHAYGKDDQVVIVFATTWDSEAEAMEFYGAWRDTRKSRFPKLKVSKASTDTEYLYECGQGLGHGRLVRRGQEVFVVEGGTLGLCKRLMEELLAIQVERK